MMALTRGLAGPDVPRGRSPLKAVLPNHVAQQGRECTRSSPAGPSVDAHATLRARAARGLAGAEHALAGSAATGAGVAGLDGCAMRWRFGCGGWAASSVAGGAEDPAPTQTLDSWFGVSLTRRFRSATSRNGRARLSSRMCWSFAGPIRLPCSRAMSSSSEKEFTSTGMPATHTEQEL